MWLIDNSTVLIQSPINSTGASALREILHETRPKCNISRSVRAYFDLIWLHTIIIILYTA